LSFVDTSNINNFYQDNHTWLYQLFNRKLSNHADAADLAHDAFLRLLKKPKYFDNNSGARAYLSHMARGMCSDLWRRQQIELAWLDTLANQPESFYPCAEQQAIIIQALSEVDAMLQQLPDKVAEAFIQTMVYGKTAKEVAQELGVTDRSIRNYLSQAMFACISLQARQQQ
jgi:RNA polymerase sigma-70 factor (ECF subfamily)